MSMNVRAVNQRVKEFKTEQRKPSKIHEPDDRGVLHQPETTLPDTPCMECANMIYQA